MTLPGNVIMMRRHNSTPHDAVAASPYFIGNNMQANRIAPHDTVKPKKSWGERLKLSSAKSERLAREDDRRQQQQQQQQQHLQQQQQQDAAHQNFLMHEYRNKYGTLSDGSALSKSMKYAETWLYGSVRQPSAAHPLLYHPQPPPPATLIPHVALCSCAEALGGTLRAKRSPSGVCKKCGGSRAPWRSSGGGGGTMRAATVRMPADTARFGGTVRVTSNRVRPSLVHAVADPYDLMRRHRLAASCVDDDAGVAVRARRAKSTSPGRHRVRRSPSPPVTRRARRDAAWDVDEDAAASASDNKRKSILECDVNAYRLLTKADVVDDDDDDVLSDDLSDNALEDVATPTPAVEKASPRGVTIGGQRMKVFAAAPALAADAEFVDDADADAKRPTSLIPRFQSPKRPQRRVKSLDGVAAKITTPPPPPPPPPPPDAETESGKGDGKGSSNSQIERRSNLISSNIKSILKKPSSTASAAAAGVCVAGSSQQPPPPPLPMTFNDTIREPDGAAEVQSIAKRPASTTTATATTATTREKTSIPSRTTARTASEKQERRKKKQVQFDDSVNGNVTAAASTASVEGDARECGGVRCDDKVIEVRFKVQNDAKLKYFGGECRDDGVDTLTGHGDKDICVGVGDSAMAPTVGRVWTNQLLSPDACAMSPRDQPGAVTLRRSLSDRQLAPGDLTVGLSKHEQTAALFHDTMRLRMMAARRTDSRQAFSHPGSTLDLRPAARRVLSPSRPKEPPPPPPLPPPSPAKATPTPTLPMSPAKVTPAPTPEAAKPKLTLLIAPESQDDASDAVINHSTIRFVNAEAPPPPPAPQLPPRHIFPFTKKQIQNINNQKRHASLQTPTSLGRGNARSGKPRPTSCVAQLSAGVATPGDAGLVHVASRARHRNSDPGPASASVGVHVRGENDECVRTVVSVCPDSPDIHRLQITTDATPTPPTPPTPTSPSGRTSIRINGDVATHVTIDDDAAARNVNKVTISVGGCASWNTFVEASGAEPTYRSNVEVEDASAQVVDRATGRALRHEYDVLELLRDPVEAVRRHLVPHVCGRAMPDGGAGLASASAMARLNSLLDAEAAPTSTSEESSSSSPSSPEASLSDAKYEASGSAGDQDYNGISVHYFAAPRFLLGDADADGEAHAHSGVYDDAENIYESIKEPIYEEIGDTPPPLPLSPPPSLDELDDKRTSRSIFEGASKYDILNYLVDAKERGYVESDYGGVNDKSVELSLGNLSSRVSNLSNVSDSSEDNMAVITTLTKDKGCADVERNDSGVGSETSKSSRSRWQSLPTGAIREDQTHLCEDCDLDVDTQVTDGGVMFAPLVCRKCAKKRAERKDTIAEIVETEEKYGGDLRIILEEFYRPMLVAGLLTSEQLSAIFLNVEELLENNAVLAEKLRDAHDIAVEQGDEDLLTVNVGSLFLEAAPMLHAFESYCTRQGGASLLLANLEKEKELLRIFLRVSQMENAVLRRMNLNSFLMVPVQRVTKYPLLLARLHKVTPAHHAGRELLRQAQHKIELHLEHMNSVAKDFSSTKLWRRISIVNGRRSSSEIDMINIKLRKMAVDVLEWNHDEVKFAMEGRMLYTNPTDNNWRKGRTIKLNPINALLVTNGKQTEDYRPEDELLLFPRKTGVREATLLLVKEKCGRYSLLRDPLYLDKCIVCCETEWEDYIEVQELASKDTFIFKAEDSERTKLWYRQLQYHSQGLGAWRRRRNALANIMINGMMTRS